MFLIQLSLHALSFAWSSKAPLGVYCPYFPDCKDCKDIAQAMSVIRNYVTA